MGYWFIFFCALSWGYGIKKVSLRLKNEFYEDKDRCQFRKLKKIKKIKTNEVCHNISFNILNGHDNAAIVVVCILSFIFPQKEKYYATGTNEHKRAHETGAQGA